MIEVCASSIESVVAAYCGGAHRVELCSALSEDGLTPSHSLIFAAKQCRFLKVHVLIRPRSGNFVYTDNEVACMEEDILHAKELGADGVVIGALTLEGDIDLSVCRQLVSAAQGMDITFHRAFDQCRDPFDALEQIISLGCNRLLTSGQATTAEAGIPMIRQLVYKSAGRIAIMPGCGVNADNAASILKDTGATEIHGSFRSTRKFGRLETDEEIVRQVVKACESHLSADLPFL